MRTKKSGFSLIIVLVIVLLVMALIISVLRLDPQPIHSSVVNTSSPASSQTVESVQIQTGDFLKRKSTDVNTAQSYICGHSKDEVLKLALSSEFSDYIPNVPEILKTVKIEEYPEYYHINYTYNGMNELNVLRCDYYEPVVDETNKKTTQSGIFRGHQEQGGFNHLVEFLFSAQILRHQSCVINCTSEEKLGVIEENENEISRTDTYVLSVSNDIPPFDTSIFSVEQKFSLNKKTGLFTEYYSRK